MAVETEVILPLAAEVRARREASIPQEWRLSQQEVAASGPLDVIATIEGKLDKREREITGWTATEAAKKLASGEVTSVEVTTAICHRAALAHQLINCLTEVFFDRALKRAADLDAQFKATGKPTGPLHGLPVSIKEEHYLSGTLTTWGFIEWVKDGPAQSDSAVTTRLLQSGAVLYAKTNVPQALMTWESTNAVWGRCLNPHNTRVGAGGSSGGEGALIAAGGSYLGVGTDIGGSIRLPSSINGVYGLKPSARRFPYNGSKVLKEGTLDAIVPTHGPLGRSIDDLELYCKMFADPMGAEMDPNMIPLGWRDVQAPSKLKVGYFIDSGFVNPVPPVSRAMTETLAALKSAGHELVEFPAIDAELAFKTIMDIFAGHDKEFRELVGPSRGGEGVCKAMSWVDTYPRPATDMSSLWDRIAIRDVLKEKYLAQWNALGIDCLVCPTLAIPSAIHDTSSAMIGAIYYTAIFNFLDLPAGVIPITKTTMQDTKPAYTPRNAFEKVVWDLYDPSVYEGTPVGVQVVGRRWGEEKVIGMMRVVDGAVKAAKGH